MNQTILTSDKIIKVKTTITEEDCIVDFTDIATGVVYDEWFQEAPWDHCDGWEHEFQSAYYDDHDGLMEANNYVNNRHGYCGSGSIIITDEQVIEWGCTGYHGCSKQVRAETIAREKRRVTIQLVKWYTEGWEYYIAEAEYGDYRDCCGGIDCVDYAETVAEECRRNVAALMEDDGYIILNRPEVKPYCRVAAFRDKIRRQLDCS